MEETKETQEVQNKATIKDVVEKISTLIVENLVASYKAEENGLQMRLPNGQTFLITVQEKI